MWVSPQSFNREWMDEFLGILKNQQPAWLSGVVFGPQVRMSLPELRAAVPQRYPIRHYPDITHSRQSQYPVPDWDVAYAVTEAPRGHQSAARRRGQYLPPAPALHHRLPDLFGRLQRRRQQDAVERARLESRRPGDRHPARLRPLFHRRALRRQLRPGPAGARAELARAARDQRRRRIPRSNSSRRWRRTAPPQTLANWRFQQALYRAYYDAYTRSRLLYETGLEDQAMRELRNARALGAVAGHEPRGSHPRPRRHRSALPRPGAPASSSWPKRCSRASACS